MSGVSFTRFTGQESCTYGECRNHGDWIAYLPDGREGMACHGHRQVLLDEYGAQVGMSDNDKGWLGLLAIGIAGVDLWMGYHVFPTWLWILASLAFLGVQGAGLFLATKRGWTPTILAVAISGAYLLILMSNFG